MKFLAVALLSLVLMTGCDVVVHLGEPDMGRTPAVKTEYPTVNLPISLRQSNWLGSKNEGSCVHATMISLLRWQNRPGTADYWRQHYGNGEWPEDLAKKFDHEGVRYAYVTNGDPAFLGMGLLDTSRVWRDCHGGQAHGCLSPLRFGVGGHSG